MKIVDKLKEMLLNDSRQETANEFSMDDSGENMKKQEENNKDDSKTSSSDNNSSNQKESDSSSKKDSQSSSKDENTNSKSSEDDQKENSQETSSSNNEEQTDNKNQENSKEDKSTKSTDSKQNKSEQSSSSKQKNSENQDNKSEDEQSSSTSKEKGSQDGAAKKTSSQGNQQAADPKTYTNDIKKSSDDYVDKAIYPTVKENVDYLKQIQQGSWDLVTREITLESKVQKVKIGLAFYAGLVDQRLLNKAVIDSIGLNFQHVTIPLKSSDERFDYFKNTLLTVIGVDEGENYGKLFNTLLSGDMVVFIEGCTKCVIIGARMYQERPVEKASTQISVKGANDAFNENLLTNVSLVRRRIKNPHLIVKNYIIGYESNTNVSVLYIEGVADEAIVKKVKDRIENIKSTNILDTSYIAYHISDRQFSVFPTQYDTERPDVVCANLFEGRVAILIDTSPFAIVVPAVFVQFIQSIEDFYQKSYIASFFRLIRVFALLICLFLPGFYISLILHHSQLLPINLLFSIAGQLTKVPFPAYLELLLIMVAFDLLREAGTRMPMALGSTLSFVGAIIIGQSAVQAGLISPIIVIVVALTGIGSLIMPNYSLNLAVTILKYVFTIIATLFGFYGLTLSIIVTLVHLSSVRSFGVDYFTPFGPYSPTGLADSIIRLPLGTIFKRKQKSSGQFPH